MCMILYSFEVANIQVIALVVQERNARAKRSRYEASTSNASIPIARTMRARNIVHGEKLCPGASVSLLWHCYQL